MSRVEPTSQYAKLDVGCGASPLPGFLGIDRIGEPDVLHDLEMFPWPFVCNSFSHIVCRHSLGHLSDVVRTMEEIHRIAKDGAVIEIVSPHFSSDNFFTDITHKHAFGYRSFDYFCTNRDCKYRYSPSATFLMLETRISFLQAKCFSPDPGKLDPMKWIGMEWLINKAPRFYEHFAAFILRANEVYFRLKVVKA